MKPDRLPRYRILAGACVLLLAGLSPAAAQFAPAPGQANPGGVFPPPPGQSKAAQDPAFPPPPGQAPAQRQDSAFPPPPAPGQAAAPSNISVAPARGGSFAVPSSGGFSGGAPQVPEAQKICLTFPALREDMEQTASAIRAASERKAPREEVCPLFKTIVVKEDKMLKFLIANQRLCGVPPNVINQVKTNHAQTTRIRNVVCSTAPAGPAAAPTLSDALGGPIIADDESAKKPGRGTFDTLTGNALQR